MFKETEMLESQQNLSPKLNSNIINFYKNQESNLNTNDLPFQWKKNIQMNILTPIKKSLNNKYLQSNLKVS